MVDLMDFPYNSALFGLVSYNDPWWMMPGLDSRTMALALKKPLIPIAEAVLNHAQWGDFMA